MLIKRSKLPPPGPMDAMVGTGPAAVHYALSVAVAGNVTGWTAEVAKAPAFDAATVERVRAFYGSRPQAGTFHFEPAGVVPQAQPEEPVERPPEPALPALPQTTEKLEQHRGARKGRRTEE